MNKERKIFLSVCGSILAVVAIAIFLSFGTGDSYAESTSDYGCTYSGWFVAGTDTDSSYNCCPTGYTFYNRQKDTLTGEWMDATCAKYVGGQSDSYTCAAIGGNQVATYFNTSTSPYKWAGYCVTAPQAAAKKSCYVCYATYTTEYDTTTHYDCPSVWQKYDNKSQADCKFYTVNYTYEGLTTTKSSKSLPGSTVTLPSAPSRDGCSFYNYYKQVGTQSELLGKVGNTFTMPQNDLTVVGEYTCNNPVTTYTITYDANGGSGAPSAQTKTQGVALTLSTTRPTRSGYTFKGWGTSSTSPTATYQPGGSYTANASATLYAVWQSDSSGGTVTTYTVTYNANGGSGAPSAQTKTQGTKLTLSSTKPTKSGFTFVHWNTKQDDSGTSYSPGGSYNTDASVTLYAQWQAKESTVTDTYTISYDANEGKGAPADQTKTKDVDITLSSTKPTRTGYTFVNWNTEADGSGTSYNSGATYNGNDDLVLFAQWSANKYTIKYDANGGSGAPSNQTKEYGEDILLSSTKPTKSGYTFGEWNTSKDGSGTTYKPGDSYTKDQSVTLYAIWGKNKNGSTDTGKTDKTDDEPVQVQTGNALILVALVTGLAALCYIFLYTKKMKTDN